MTLPLIGIIGGGQLAQMMAQSAIGLGLPLRLLAEGDDVSAAAVVPKYVVGDYTDPETVYAFAQDCDVITFDHEHVPPEILRELIARGVAVRPGPDALIHAQDKAVMRERLSVLGIPCPTWRVVATPEDLSAFGDEIGWPIIAKASRGGYDGHGVWKLDGPADVERPFAEKAEHAAIVAEEFVDFIRELSVIVCRAVDGQVVAYPLTETTQTDGICTETRTAASMFTAEQQSACTQIGRRIAEDLGVVGLLAVELMMRADGSVVVNELAMRPHNTGHWTQDGAVTSQFENHLRAVAGLPLGSTDPTADWLVMANVLGGERDRWPEGLAAALAADPAAHVHWYGKTWRPGRKLGHVTCAGDLPGPTVRRARDAAARLRGDLA